MRSWKTTVLGVGAILVAVGGALVAMFDESAETVVNVEATVAAVMAGLGLIFARDNGVPSEDAGVR
jgi:hypothetical protein